MKLFHFILSKTYLKLLQISYNLFSLTKWSLIRHSTKSERNTELHDFATINQSQFPVVDSISLILDMTCKFRERLIWWAPQFKIIPSKLDQTSLQQTFTRKERNRFKTISGLSLHLYSLIKFPFNQQSKIVQLYAETPVFETINQGLLPTVDS